MQINKVTSNNTTPTFGAKLVFRKEMLNDDLTKKIVQKFENKTKDIEGTMYLTGFYHNDLNTAQKNTNVHYKNKDYLDGATLKDAGAWSAFYNSDSVVEIMSCLLNTFKIRENAVNATKVARAEIEKLQTGINATFEKMHKDMDKALDLDIVNVLSPQRAFNTKLKERCNNSFVNKEIDGHQGLSPSFNTLDTLTDSFEEDSKYIDQLLNRNNK